jgi:hypothetical protein
MTLLGWIIAGFNDSDQYLNSWRLTEQYMWTIISKIQTKRLTSNM